MLSGFLLVLAAFVTSSPGVVTARAIYTSSAPMCDELGLSDENREAAERAEADEREAISPAPLLLGNSIEVADYARRLCSGRVLASKPAVVLDCNDARATLWLHEMVGSCDMPRTVAYGAQNSLGSTVRVVRAARGERRPSPTSGRGTICSGPDCLRDPPPLRPALPLDDLRGFSLVELASLAPALPEGPVFQTALLRPPSLPPVPLERPPRLSVQSVL